MTGLTKQEKKLLVFLLDRPYALQALDYDYDQNDEKEFKKNAGSTFKKAEKTLEKLVTLLKN